MSDRTDAELVRMVRERGDTSAYGELIARYQGHAYGLAYSFVGNWEEAQDIAQEAFIHAYINLHTLKVPAKFPVWLRRIVFSTCMHWLRKFRPELYHSLGEPEDFKLIEKMPDSKAASPLEHAMKKEMSEVVLAAIAELPPKYRIPLTMFHLDGLSYEKVAEFLEIPVGTVKSLINRAKKKLKPALKSYATEVLPMVSEVFNEHKLPAEFSRKVLENVPILAWGKGKECSFAGALEAALSVTEYPFSYTDIMGFTGLAFRVRWFKPSGEIRWCASSPAGEMAEEIEAATHATGWELKCEVHKGEPNMVRYVPEIVASINAGKPVLAYDDRLDMAVVYGYGEGGKTLLFRDYHKGETLHELPASGLGWMIIYLGGYSPELSRSEAFIESLKLAVRNWRRRCGKAGPGEYWYGETALGIWIDDLSIVDSLTQKEKETLFFVSWWNFTSLVDARNAAISFLRGNVTHLPEQSAHFISKAAALYEREVKSLDCASFTKHDAFFGPWSGKSIKDWTADVRKREREILTEACRLENNAITEIEKALSSL